MRSIKWILGLAILGFSLHVKAQRVGIGTDTPNPSAALDISSTNGGILIPRLTLAQRNAISSPATGLMVWVTDTGSFHYYTGTIWEVMGAGEGGGGGSSTTIKDGDGNTFVETEYTPNENQIRFQTDGVEVMRINNTGQVGIGTDEPGGTLDVAGDVQASLFIDRANPVYYLYPSNPQTSMSVAGSVKASLFSDASSSAFYLDPASTGISLKTAGYIHSTAYYDDTNQEYFLDPGNVGISLKVAGSADAPAFRDRNNLTFLLDPASTSVLNNLTLNPATTGPASGLKIRTQNQQYWSINGTDLPDDQDLCFWYNGISRAQVQWDINVGDLDFTAQHRSLPAEGDITDYRDLEGYIVVSNGTINNLDGSTRPGIMESLPKVKLSDRVNDKRIYGVIARIEENEPTSDSAYREYSQGAFVTMIERASPQDYRIVVNASGEGGVWVSNWNGNIENGDLVTTSPIQGIGMKQADDLLHNYTVAKIVMDCDFQLDSKEYICKEITHEGQTYRMAFLACVYQL